MRWVKYLFALIFILGTAGCGWLLHMREFGHFAVAAGMLLLFAGIFLFAVLPVLRADALLRELRKTGVALQATILEVNGTSKYLNELPILRVKLKYTHGQKEVIREIEQPIPFERLSFIRPAAHIGVLADPDNDRKLVLDW